MRVTPTEIADVLIVEPRLFADERGFFLESYNRRAFREATGVDVEFVQDNHSRSARNVLRGLHYQIRQPQGKLVRVTVGEVWDVAVDLRASSATFGKWVACTLDAKSARCLWVPPGFAHGFLVVSDAGRGPVQNDRLLRALSTSARCFGTIRPSRSRGRCAASP
jgi:dTDP-4-dehydrorhamnose 3,5-epimerase